MKNNSFFTNKVEYTINRDEILRTYDLIKVSIAGATKKSDIFYSKLWKILKSDIEAKAYFKQYKEIYILTKKNEIAKLDKDAILKLDCDVILVNYKTIIDIPDYILSNIMITNLGSSDNMFSIGNFQNGLYEIVKSGSSKVITLKFYISKDNILNFDVVTFSKTKLNKNNQNSIFYIVENNKLIRIIEPNEASVPLFTKVNKFSKSNIDFMIYYKNFPQSKVGRIAKFLRLINISFPKIVNITLKKEDFIEHTIGDDKDKRVKLLKDKICEILEHRKIIQLYDYENRLSKEIKLKVENTIKSYFNKEIDIKFVDKLEANKVSLIFIYNKKSYTEENDPYIKLKLNNKKSQIVTYDVLNKILDDNKSPYLQVVLKELIIKLEIIENNFLLSNKIYDFLEYQFFIPKKDSWDKIVFTKEGFKKEDFSVLDLMNVSFLDSYRSKIELIGYKDGDFFAIEKTDIKILPDVLKTYELDEAEVSLRVRDSKIYSVAGFGIHYKIYSDYFKYFSATNTKNLNQRVSKANNVRKVYIGSKNFDYSKFLSSMDEYYIRNKELTVLPLIMKYIREFIELEENI